MPKRYRSGGQESLPEFSKRRFCNRSCKGVSQLLENPVNGTGARGRKQARSMVVKSKCEACETSHRLEVHHRDGNPANNEPSNLAVLCMICHRKEHKTEACSIPGCEKVYCALGYCSMHYQRFKKYGDPLVKQPNRHHPPQKHPM